MSNTKHKFAEDITAFGLFILAIILIVILMSSCSTTKHNYIAHDNGGCGWNR